MDKVSNATRARLLAGILGLFILLLSPLIHADALKPVRGEFNVVMQGVDPDTGELIFEGWKTGALPGQLTTRTALIKQTGVVLHLATRWTLVTPWGETLKGENTALLNTVSLHFQEHGVIVEANGNLADRVGNFVIIHGEVSDVYFWPGLTEASASVTYVPSQPR